MCGEMTWGSGYDGGADGGVASNGSPMVASNQRRCTSRSNDSEKLERSEERQRCTSEAGETTVWVVSTTGSEDTRRLCYRGHRTTCEVCCTRRPKCIPLDCIGRARAIVICNGVLTGLFGGPLACRVARNEIDMSKC
jgi:hypothetical protein